MTTIITLAERFLFLFFLKRNELFDMAKHYSLNRNPVRLRCFPSDMPSSRRHLFFQMNIKSTNNEVCLHPDCVTTLCASEVLNSNVV